MKCEHCGADFEPKNARQRFCSRKCCVTAYNHSEHAKASRSLYNATHREQRRLYNKLYRAAHREEYLFKQKQSRWRRDAAKSEVRKWN